MLKMMRLASWNTWEGGGGFENVISARNQWGSVFVSTKIGEKHTLTVKAQK